VTQLAVTFIEVPAVAVKQTLHHFRKRLGPHFHKKMKMIGHQNVGVKPERISFLYLPKKSLELTVVTYAFKDRLPLVPSADDVIHTPREMDARPPAHACLLASAQTKSK